MTVTTKSNAFPMFHDPVMGSARFFGRVPKPSFKYYSATQVVVPASEVAPVYYVIGGQLYKVTADMTATISAPAAATVYYLYAEANSLSVSLAINTMPPTTRTGEWTYIGSCGIHDTNSTMYGFVSCGGLMISDIHLEQTNTTATSYTEKTMAVMPVTAKYAVGAVMVTGTAVSNAVGVNGSGVDGATSEACLNVSGQQNNNDCIVALKTYNKIWLKSSSASNTAWWRNNGWIEDPSEYL